MAKNKLADIDLTFGNNTDALGQSTAGSANANTIDTIFQKLMVMLALFYDEIGGTGTVGGTADAITLATNATYPFQALASGLVVTFKAGSANTGAATINVDSLGAKAIRRQGDTALSANDIVANGVYMLRYDTAYNAAAGAWVLLNPTVSSSISAASTTETLTGTDTSKYLTADGLAALWEKGSDIASAGTISIGEGGYFHVTGTTTITDIDWATAKDGRAAILVFDGVLTLTYNATTLVLPGAANITTAAGDTCLVVQDSGDNARVVMYSRAATAPSSSAGTWTLISSTSASGDPLTIALGATYKQLKILGDGISASTSDAFTFDMAVSDDGTNFSAAVVISASGSAGDSSDMVIDLMNTGVSGDKHVGAVTQTPGGTSANVFVGAFTTETGITHSIRFTVTGAEVFDGGTFYVYGLT